MKKIWKQNREKKNKIMLFLLIAIIAIIGFVYYRNNETKQVITAKNPEVKATQVTVEPEGYIGIYSADDLANIQNGLSGQYILMADIDMAGKTHTIIGQTSSAAFKGIFDGNLHTISNLSIESSNQYVGLFGYINGGTVKNLVLENETVKGTSSSTTYIGGLAGYNSTGIIEGVRITGTSKIEDASTNIPYIGGLVGHQIAGTVQNSYVEGKIVTPTKSRDGYIGGLIGYVLNNAIISENGSKVDISNNLTSNSYVGGLIGYSYGNLGSPTISKNYSKSNIDGSTITSKTTNVGGLIGYTKYAQTIEQSYSIGNIKIGTNTSNVGGLIGYNEGYTNGTSQIIVKINNSYSNVEITGIGNNSTYIGGLLGYVYMTTTNNTYAVGKIHVNTTKNKGGLVGYYSSKTLNSGIVFDSSKRITNSYWSPETVGISSSISTVGEARTIKEMLYESNYTNWDFNDIWKIEADGKSLPYLLDNKEPEILEENIEHEEYEGKGTEDDPFLIYTVEQLQYINSINCIGSYYYKIMNDIDASSISNFKPIGTNTNPFIGILYGNEHKINNLNIESSDKYIGLFGYNNGKISNIEVNGNIKNVGNIDDVYIGQIVGYNNGSIERVHSAGIIENIGTITNGYIGGIAGFNNSAIKLSYNTGRIISNNINNVKVGGIVGSSNKGVAFSYSKGTMEVNSTTSTIGGIAGENTGRIVYTYAIDNIQKSATTLTTGGIAGSNTGTIEKSYWNIGGIEHQEGNGTLKTLQELRKQATYENWNFDKIWSIKENEETPILVAEKYYYDDEYWEWHTRITTDDQAYNGNHIEILDSIKFYGYGIPSYKDFLYKNYTNAGEKTFSFVLDETKASYHTLDGAGFIFNAKQENGKMSGYILLVQEQNINLYRIDNVDIKAFEETTGKTVASYAGNPIATVAKKSSTQHKFVVKTTPTNVQVIDNDEEVLNVDLDYSKHIGENFGLISSYVDHNCSILTEIEFSEFKLEIKDYTVPVLKVDKNNNPLEGAKFQVKNETGEIVRQGTTDSEGIFKIQGLQEGVYTFEEIEAPSKYALKKQIYTFKLTNDGKAVDVNTGEELTFKIENEPLKIELKKYETGTTHPVSGAIIGLLNQSGEAIRDNEGNQITATSDEQGNVIFTNIETGTYKYKELQAPNGYKTNENIYTCDVNTDGSVEFKDDTKGIIYNEKIKAEHIYITKYRTGTEIPVAGAIIGLYDNEGNEVLGEDRQHIKLTTLENGQIDFATVKDLGVGTYQYKEIQAPQGYVLNNTMYKFTVNNDGTISFIANEEGANNNGIIYNDRVMSVAGATKIKKYKTGTQMPLSGAVIELYDKSGNPLLDSEGHQIQLTTNEQGEISIPSLEYGTYQYKEIQAPEGYILNNTMYKFTVNNHGTISFVENAEGTNNNGIIYNDRVKADHTFITKYKSGTTTPLSGAVIGLYNEQGEKLLDSEGNHIQLTTNEQGEIDFRNLEVGTYQYKEEKAPEGYILNTSMYKFTVDNTGNVTFENDTNGIIYNERVKAEHVYITKYETGTQIPISGAIIGLYDQDKIAIRKLDGEQVKLTTNEDGKIDFTTVKDIEPGIYYYQEIGAPDGYILNNTMYKFTVNNNGDVEFENNTNGIIYNERVKADNVYITKYKTGTEIPISGAVIGLYDEGKKPILGENDEHIKLTTDENGRIDFATIKDIQPGIYYYKETKAPAGYVLNNIMYKFIVNNNGDVEFENDTKGIIYNDTVMSGEGTEKIRKYKTGSNIPVSGAIIGLFDMEGTPLKDSEQNEIRLTTNENGEVLIPSLEVGMYQYKEIQAPAGYILNNTMYKFQVNNDGTITFIENEITDKTGGNGRDGIIYDERVKAKQVIITKYRTGTEDPVEGAEIGLFDNEGDAILDDQGNPVKLTTNENGQIDFTTVKNLEPGIYKYQELKAPAGYILSDTIYKFEVKNDGTVEFIENEDAEGNKNGQGKDGIIYNNRVKADSVVIIKYETGTKNPVSGAVIGLYDASGKPILGKDGNQIKLTTSENGQIDFATVKDLEPGTYKYQELKAPAGYVLNNAICEFVVNSDGTVEFTESENGLGRDGIIYNDRVRAGQIIITKYKTGTTNPVPGAIIGLFDSEGREILGLDGEQVKLITGNNGQIIFTNLKVGIYQYKEIEAPVGYVRNDTMYKFEVNNDGTITYIENENADQTGGKGKDGIIYNDRVKAEHITIKKYESGTTKPVPGAVIGLYDEQGNPIYKRISDQPIDSSDNTSMELEQIKLTTNEKGEIDFTNLEVGTYQYKELEAPLGYRLNETMYKFTVNSNGTVTFENDTEGIIHNEKIPTEDAIIIKYKKGTTIPVPGAVIGLYNENGDPILDNQGNQVTQTTGSNGQIRFTNLEIGTYQYKEIQAPAGYVLNNIMYSFTINAYGTITFGENTNTTDENKKQAIIYNEIVKRDDTIITKYKTGTTIPVPGAVIGLFDADEKPILGSDNKQIVLTTNEKGQINFTNLEVGTYKYQEIEAPEGYIINSTMYEFTINADKTITFTESTNADGGGRDGVIYNKEKQKGTITITKYKTGTTIPVSGAEIGLFDKEGNPILGDNGEQIKSTTLENGQVQFINLKEGVYQYKELKAPDGYILNETMYKFTVDENGTITYIENANGSIYNEKIKMEHIIITKYETGTTTPVQGAVIGLFSENGNEILNENGQPIRLTTDENGRIDFTNLEVGTYQYKEIQAPEGYVLNETMYKFIVNADKTVTFVEQNGNGAYGIIYNDRKTSDIIIIMKYRTGTKIPVQGAVIGLFDKHGEPIKDNEGNQIKLTTNEEGKIAFTLRQGEYQYKEIEAPEGYILNDTMYKFTVGNDGKVIFESGNIIYNNKIKTGEVTIIKYEEGTTTKVAGAVIGLFDKHGEAIEDEKGNQIKLTTNEKGQVTFKDLPKGEYQYKELQAPQGYKLNSEMYKFTIDEEGNVEFEDNTQGIIYNSKEEKKPDNTIPPDNITPPDNTTPPDNNTPPINNTKPENNTVPIENNTPPQNNIVQNNSSTNTKRNVIPSKKNSIAESIKQGILPKTGAGKAILVMIVALISSAGYYAIKYKKTK